ncbi:P-II family nitrogen regulator [Rhodohalobacter sp. 614A]|uniref:P-II family nitrogen regulator n=1 Tax=Rhodohalobacter sp. 614A TaxID=2908649 RepID=UPI001F470C00|nr:P-II family nitrogen regulator [Rhodohalobacter sp. 614A]
MNEVKAFIRKRKAEEVVDGLEAEGYCCMTVLEVMGLGRMSDLKKNLLQKDVGFQKNSSR